MAVKATIEHLLDSIEQESIAAHERTVTFSIRMSESDHDTLTYLAEFFSMKKTPFANMLLQDAMQETLKTIAEWRGGGDREKAQEAYFELLEIIQSRGVIREHTVSQDHSEDSSEAAS